jgi:iron complex outermembrane receptor protein
VAGAWTISPAWTIAAHALTTFEPPSVEQLFSEGPHLAAYSYEIGDADLGAERGFGAEIQARYEEGGTTATLALFVNRFQGYIFPRDTGELEVGPGEEGLLARYQYAGIPAVLSGVECALGWQPRRWLRLEANASAVRGTQTDSGVPLPMIPPFGGHAGAYGIFGRWQVGAVAHAATAQNRTDEFEDPTDGWVIADLQVQWTRVSGSSVHGVSLVLENVGDAEYHRHLSRVRSVMPEPGRNLKALYRFQW